MPQMDPLVNPASVDAFFDSPVADSFNSFGNEPSSAADNGFGDGFNDIDYSDINNTEFYTPGNNRGTPAAKADATDATPAQVPAPAQAPQTVDFATENAALKQRVAELELYKPLGEMIQRNPNFLTGVEKYLQEPTQPVAPKEPELVRPSAPVKPANFDYAEATVPGTESFKYREAMDEYPVKLAEYVDKRDQIREAAMQKQQAEYTQRVQMQQAQAQLASELTTKYGYAPDQVQDFIQTMSDPNSRSLANLVALHAITKGQKGAVVAGATKAALKNVPLPLGVVGGGGGNGQAKQLNDSDSFNFGLMSARHI